MTEVKHVNTMEAHHAPNWSRKQHVDGAHDNATKPKTKHAPIDNESWSHADARAARLGRTESLSGYLFGSAFSAPERQRPAEENRRLWPEEHDEDAATYFTPFDEGRSGVRPDGPETTSTGENKFHLEFQGNHEPHDGECEAVRLPGEDHRPIDEDEPLYAGNVRLAEVIGERKESFDLTPRFYGPDEARAHVLERDEPQPEFDVAGHVRLKPALHEDTPDLLAELVENGLKEGLKLRMDHLDAIDDEVAAIYAEPAVVAKVPTREELEQRHPSLPPPIYSDRFSTHGTRPHDPHERDVQSILRDKSKTKEEKAIAINQLDVPQETKNRALQDLENDATIEDATAPSGVPDDRRSVHAADRYGKHPTEAKRVPLAAQHSRATLEQMTQNDEGLEAETLETSRDGQRLQPMRKPLAAVPEDAAAPVPVEPLTPEAAVDRPEPALTARVASLRPSPADEEEKEPEFGGAGLAAAKARDEEKEERRRRRKKKKAKSESKDDASADSQKRKRKHKSSKKKRESSSSAAAPAVVVEDAPAPAAEAPGPTADQAAPGDESTCVIA